MFNRQGGGRGPADEARQRKSFTVLSGSFFDGIDGDVRGQQNKKAAEMKRRLFPGTEVK